MKTVTQTCVTTLLSNPMSNYWNIHYWCTLNIIKHSSFTCIYNTIVAASHGTQYQTSNQSFLILTYLSLFCLLCTSSVVTVSASVWPVAAGEHFLRRGCTQFNKQFFTINQTVRLIWTQLLYLYQSSPLKQTLYRVRFVSWINNAWVRHCHVIENCAATDHESSLDFSILGWQNHPFQLRSEDADWLNFVTSWIRIWLNSTKTRLLWAISRSCWQAERSYCDVKTYFFHRRFSNISHHTNIHLNNGYNYYFVCGRRPSALYWPATTVSDTPLTPPAAPALPAKPCCLITSTRSYSTSDGHCNAYCKARQGKASLFV